MYLVGSPVTVASVITVLSALVALLIESGLFKSISLSLNGLLALGLQMNKRDRSRSDLYFAPKTNLSGWPYGSSSGGSFSSSFSSHSSYSISKSLSEYSLSFLSFQSEIKILFTDRNRCRYSYPFLSCSFYVS